MIGSSNVVTVELTVVVVPSTCKFPLIVTRPLTSLSSLGSIKMSPTAPIWSAWNLIVSICTFPVAAVASISTTSSADNVNVLVPEPALVEDTVRFLSTAVFCVSSMLKSPSPVLSICCVPAPSNMKSGSLNTVLTLISTSPFPLSPVLFAPNNRLPEVLFTLT